MLGPFTAEFLRFAETAYCPDPKDEGRVLLDKQEHVCSLTQEQALFLGERLLNVAASVKSLDEMLGLSPAKEDFRYTLGEAITEFKRYALAELALCRQAAADLESNAAAQAAAGHSREAKIQDDMATVIRLVATKYGTMLRQMAVRAPAGKSFYTDVVTCARCGENHQHVLFEPFANPPPDYTHYGRCPTGAPILMRQETTNG